MTRNPITPVAARGDAFTVGHALGQACAMAIPAHVFATEEYQALDQRWRGSDYLGQLEAAARAAYPQYLREIEGLAAGAGQDFETIFLWNCRGDLHLPENFLVEPPSINDTMGEALVNANVNQLAISETRRDQPHPRAGR